MGDSEARELVDERRTSNAVVRRMVIVLILRCVAQAAVRSRERSGRGKGRPKVNFEKMKSLECLSLFLAAMCMIEYKGSKSGGTSGVKPNSDGLAKFFLCDPSLRDL